MGRSTNRSSCEQQFKTRRMQERGKINSRIIGKRFGRLLAVEHAFSKPRGKHYFRCVCECGGVRTTRSDALLAGITVSCGCLQKERVSQASRKHGLCSKGKPDTEYNSWINMIGRCYKPSHAQYKYYGARGITVCQEWRDSPEKFLADMGRKPSRKHTLDRIDNDLPYSMENCRWATPEQQGRNKRNNTLITYDGLTLTLSEWAERLSTHSNTISTRLKKGWTVEEALFAPRSPGTRRFANRPTADVQGQVCKRGTA